MPSGGARTRSGPAPDPNALRRDRNLKGDDWVTLPSTGLPRAPAWPLTDPNEREEGFWQGLWTEKPQAHMWALLQLELEVALYCRKLSEAEKPRSSTLLGTLVRQMGDSLGLTTTGLRANRWKITGEVAEPERKQAPKRCGPSSRDRLKVVQPPGD